MKYTKTFEAYTINEAKTSTELLDWIEDAENKKIKMTLKSPGEGTTKSIETLIPANKNGLWKHGDLWIDFKDEFKNKKFTLLLMTPKVLYYDISGGWKMNLEKI